MWHDIYAGDIPRVSDECTVELQSIRKVIFTKLESQLSHPQKIHGVRGVGVGGAKGATAIVHGQSQKRTPSGYARGSQDGAG